MDYSTEDLMSGDRSQCVEKSTSGVEGTMPRTKSQSMDASGGTHSALHECKPRSVTIIYRFLPQYRVEFFESLRKQLAAEQITLRLIYGKNRVCPKQDEMDLPWGTPVHNASVTVGAHRLYWQSLPKWIYDSNLIVLMQENKILSNWLTLFRARRDKCRVAMWGHGINFQGPRASVGNTLKRLTSKCVDWWFAYTPGVRDILVSAGVNTGRVTVVQNAINTNGLMREAASVTAGQLERLRQDLSLEPGPIAVFCGAMSVEKRVDFLLDAAIVIRERNPGFQLILMGAGSMSEDAQSFCRQHSWAKFIGPKFGAERVPYFMLADVLMMPGLVGLVVLDSFALGVPMITTASPFHGPEIEYLEDGVTGLITENNLDAYCAGVEDILRNSDLRHNMRTRCLELARKYTLEAMVSNFANGVKQAMDMEPLH